jgi:hypothetical protein
MRQRVITLENGQEALVEDFGDMTLEIDRTVSEVEVTDMAEWKNLHKKLKGRDKVKDINETKKHG